MAGIETSQTFANNDQVTAASLNGIITNSKLNTSAVDGDGSTTGTIHVNASGVLSVGAINTANINDNQVTLAKMAQLADGKVIGNASGSTADPAATSIVMTTSAGDTNGLLFDNDDMLDNDDTAGGSATRGATQQSIKTYIDSDAVKLAGFTPAEVVGGSTDGIGARHETIALPNGLVMKVGALAPADPADTTTTVDFSALADGADFSTAVYCATVEWEKTGTFAAGSLAYVDTLDKSQLIIDHTAGPTLLHYVVYGR